ncbi:MAG: 50S ribosomal protein L4 [Deltaproteobacteria bacterium]|nr:50S ribosomal protein L4 [Deltaproteobacteria bacterium]MBI4373980.1 50S ribosomal protein L4 [Deltaproteobacteria bacterium]
MQLEVYNSGKKKVGEVKAPEFLSSKPREGLIYQVAVQQLANRRQGNARVKNRHEVTGSTRKIYRQKGTGRARHGDVKAPLFVGGGRAFGPKPRDWSSVLPRKIREGAIRDLLAMKQAEGKLWLLDSFQLSKPKTKEVASLFASFGATSGLLVTSEKNSNIEKSVRNLPRHKGAHWEALSVTDLLGYEHLLMTQEAFEKFAERYS